MSDGITIYCPNCGELKAVKKEYDRLKVKLEMNKNGDWYDSTIPVYTCKNCNIHAAVEWVCKNNGCGSAKEKDDCGCGHKKQKHSADGCQVCVASRKRIGCGSAKEKDRVTTDSVPSKARVPILTESKKSVNKEKVINTNIKNGCEKERTGFRFVRREDLEAEMNSPSQAPKEEKGREK